MKRPLNLLISMRLDFFFNLLQPETELLSPNTARSDPETNKKVTAGVAGRQHKGLEHTLCT